MSHALPRVRSDSQDVLNEGPHALNFNFIVFSPAQHSLPHKYSDGHQRGWRWFSDQHVNLRQSILNDVPFPDNRLITGY